MDTKEFEIAVAGCSGCVICLKLIENNNELYFGSCLNSFHKECIEIWYSKNSHCPKCGSNNINHDICSPSSS